MFHLCIRMHNIRRRYLSSSFNSLAGEFIKEIMIINVFFFISIEITIINVKSSSACFL